MIPNSIKLSNTIISMISDVIKVDEIKKVDPVFGQLPFDNHEQLVFSTDKDQLLQDIIVIHNTILGLALGETSM